MPRVIRTWFLTILLWGGASGCHAAQAPVSADPSAPGRAPPYCSRWISGQEAIDRVAHGATLLDVRTPEEFKEGHLDGATHIPVDELEARIDEVPEQEHVIVYCASGRRAHRAARLLAEKGRSVSEIGHMNRYRVDVRAGCAN